MNADAPSPQVVDEQSEYYTVDEGSGGWTIFWPDRPGYFYGFGYGEEAEVRAKSVCRALNRERALWGAAPGVLVDEATALQLDEYLWREHGVGLGKTAMRAALTAALGQGVVK